MRLSLFVVDFHLEEAALEGADHLPALPALESLLRRSRRLPGHPDWRSALVAEVGLPVAVAAAPARIAARLTDAATDGVWLAQPVHRVAGLSSVNLHPAGLLRLSAAEAAAWSEDFNRDFAATGLRLHPLPPGLLLEGLLPAGCGSGDPAGWLGAALAAGPATEADRPLRKASAEIEMWLHDHPRNRQRERAGELAINGLWLWGGQAADLPSTTPVRLPAAFGEDPFLRGLWRAKGGEVHAAQRLADLPEGVPAGVVVQSAAARSTGDQPMDRLERDWFAPLCDALARRELRSLRLWMGGRGWEFATARLLRPFWRPARRWWREVAA
jgi:hypothetical protein